MTPLKQSNRHDPENGIFGDCYRTCFAMIFDMNPEDLPHFVVLGMDREGTDKEVKGWLRERGFDLFTLFFPGEHSLDAVAQTMDVYNPTVPVIISGKSPGGEWNHSTVYHAGQFFDPGHSNANPPLDGPCLPDGNWWIEIVTKRSDCAMKGGQ